VGFENGRVVRVTIQANGPGTLTKVNTFHYDIDDGDFIDHDNDMQDLADTFRDDVLPHVVNLIRPSWTLQPVVVVEEKDPQNPTATRKEWTSGTPQAGTNSSSDELLPSGASPIAKLTTTHIGRRATGRIWPIYNVDEGSQAGGIIGSGTLAVLQAYLDAIPREPDLALGGSGASADWSVYSRTARAADQDPYLSKITGVTLRNQLHFLRSRADY